VVDDAEARGEGDCERAQRLLIDHRVIGLPTDTVYGIGALAHDLLACDRIFALKGRPDGLALPVLVADVSQARALVSSWEHSCDALARAFWPGPLTIVVDRREHVLLGIAGDGVTIGLRCPDHEVVRELCSRVGPLAVTSANRHGEAPATTPQAVHAIFGDELSFVLDGGTCEGLASTVVALEHGHARLVRKGAVAFENVLLVLARSD
jgi:L-threonylcarbamoyladenylate synthase